MNDSAPKDPRSADENAPRPGKKPDRVESYAGDNVITIIVDEEGDNTIGPAPEHLRKHLQDFRRRRGVPDSPPDAG
jgi:hypothetical protein